MREADALAVEEAAGSALQGSLRASAGADPASIHSAVYRLLGIWRAGAA
jgi:hypothetical protein